MKTHFAERLADENRKPTELGRIRLTAGIVMVAATALSTVLSPMSWQLLAIYAALGVVIGVLELLGTAGAFVGMLLLLFGPEVIREVQATRAPEWHSQWWQAVLIAVSTSVVVFFALRAFKRSSTGKRA